MPPLKNSYFINTIYLFMKMIIVMITVDSMNQFVEVIILHVKTMMKTKIKLFC